MSTGLKAIWSVLEKVAPWVLMALLLACFASKDDKHKTMKVGPKGGTVESDSASVSIPPGALDENVEIGVGKDDSPNKAIDDDKDVAGDPYAFTPHGTMFSKPVELTIPVDDDATGVAKLDDDKDTTLEPVPGADVVGGQATVMTTSFSIYVGIRARSDAAVAKPDATTGQSALMCAATATACEAPPDPGVSLLAFVPDAGNVADLSLSSCCTDTDRCGVESPGLLDGLGCILLDRPGTVDSACAAVAATVVLGNLRVPGSVAGCCQTQTSECGYDLGAIKLDLRNVDSGAFPLPSETTLNLGGGCVAPTQATMNATLGIAAEDVPSTPIACGQ